MLTVAPTVGLLAFRAIFHELSANCQRHCQHLSADSSGHVFVEFIQFFSTAVDSDFHEVSLPPVIRPRLLKRLNASRLPFNAEQSAHFTFRQRSLGMSFEAFGDAVLEALNVGEGIHRVQAFPNSNDVVSETTRLFNQRGINMNLVITAEHICLVQIGDGQDDEHTLNDIQYPNAAIPWTGLILLPPIRQNLLRLRIQENRLPRSP
jgi:hypothetical protein